jgi:hypothetical protein
MKDIFARELYNKLFIDCTNEEQVLVLQRLYEYVH